MPLRRTKPDSLQENFERMRADYAGAKETRFTRNRDRTAGMGRPGDYHIRNQVDYLRMMERARSMDRDDIVVGQIVDRAVSHTVQGGFTPDPFTGDKGVNREWKARWLDYASDPEQVDLAGEMEFTEMEVKILRAMDVDGDHFVLPYVGGQLELVEAHRCQSSKGTKRAICGVVIDGTRKRQEYWFTKNDVDPMAAPLGMKDIQPYPARDADGHRNVFHVYNPKRVSLTRGITALAPLFDFAGMFEDTMFAGVLKQQIAACFVIFRQRGKDWRGGKTKPAPVGSEREETQADGSVRTMAEISPGMEITGAQGEELQGFNPPAIGGEFLPMLEMVMTLLGVNLGLPLVMVLMDAGASSFSGWRGAVDQARMGFRQRQRMLERKLHRPVWQFNVRRWLAGDPALRERWERELNKPMRERQFNPFANHWNKPAWEYIEPFKDAMGDSVKVEKGLTSMRRVHAARGFDIDEIWDERIGDTMRLFFKAQKAAERWNNRFPDAPITFERVLLGPFASGISDLALQMAAQENEPQAPQKSGAKSA